MTRYNTTTAEENGIGNVDYLVNRVRSTAPSNYNNSQNNNRHGYQHNYYHDDGVNDDDNNTEQTTTDTMTRSSRNSSGTRVSLEDNYSRAMSRMKRGGDFYPNYDRQSFREEENEKRTTTTSRSSGSGNGKNGSRISRNNNNSALLSSRLSGSSGNRENQNRATSRQGSEEDPAGSKRSNLHKDSRLSRGSINSANTTASTIIKKMVEKRTISGKDPSEETIAIFGAYGVTGNHFLKFAMEAGYKVQALILPGMEMNDVACNDNLQLVTGSFDEDEKIRKVVKGATYVVCLLNDCDRSLHHQDQENLPPPIGNTDESDVDNSFSLSLNFMHNLVPILEESATCRVLLYQVSYESIHYTISMTIQYSTIFTLYLN